MENCFVMIKGLFQQSNSLVLIEDVHSMIEEFRQEMLKFKYQVFRLYFPCKFFDYIYFFGAHFLFISAPFMVFNYFLIIKFFVRYDSVFTSLTFSTNTLRIVVVATKNMQHVLVILYIHNFIFL